MEQYVGLDASLKLTAICVVDRTGKIQRERVGKCTSGHFSRVVVSDFGSLRRDIVFRSLLARQSPTAKIPFQTCCAPARGDVLAIPLFRRTTGPLGRVGLSFE
jgi:hypothetical protein